jgi:hypothetical protein
VSEVPREFIGLARDFIQRVRQTDAEVTRVIQRVEAIILPRLRRHKHTLRPEQVRAVERIWGDMPTAFRLGDPIFERSPGGLQIDEVRLRATRRRMAHWETQDNREPAIAIAHVVVSMTRKARWHCTWTENVTFGLHAIGRRYERGDGRSDAAILRDLDALIHLAGREGIDVCAVQVPAGGWWKGRVGYAVARDATTGEEKGSFPALAVETFTPD